MRLPGGHAAAESEPGRSRAQDVNEQTARVGAVRCSKR